MSSLGVYAVPHSGPAEPLQDFGNSWLGAMFCWSNLARRYLGDPNRFLFDQEEMDRLWKLADDGRLAAAERLTLRSTFDRVIVPAGSFAALATAYREFCRLHPGRSHFGGLADLLDGADPGLLGVGFQWTSVAENLWWIPGDEDPDDGRMFDASRDMDHGYRLLDGAGEARERTEGG